MNALDIVLIHAVVPVIMFYFFFFNDTATTEIYTLSLHDALPISAVGDEKIHRRRQRDAEALARLAQDGQCFFNRCKDRGRSEEHTSELQSPCNLVCRLLLEKKKKETLLNVTYRSLYKKDAHYMYN